MVGRRTVVIPLIAVALAAAQDEGQRLVTLDARIFAARRVNVGTLIASAPLPSGATRLTVAVRETLKGPATTTLILSPYDAPPPRGHRLLVHDDGWLDLDAPAVWAATADFTFLRSPLSILRFARAYARRIGDAVGPTRTVSAPTERFVREGGRLQGRPVRGVIVPVDARLERRARREIASPYASNRQEGLAYLAPFPSPENVALVRKLLQDPVRYQIQDAPRNWGVEVWSYPLRRLAALQLRDWGVEIGEPPVLTDSYDRTATTKSLLIAELPPAYMSDTSYMARPRPTSLSGFRRLTDLTVIRYDGAIEPAFAFYAEARRLETLDVYAWEGELTAENLRPLTRLRRLRKLMFFYVKLTDSALATLARIPSLRRLEIREDNATPGGLAVFRWARPDVEIARPLLAPQ